MLKRLLFALLMAAALPSFGAATVSLYPMPKWQAITAAGVPCVGCKLYTYTTGTSTPLSTYTDSTGVTANANPVVLDSRGEASVWFDATKVYRLVLKTAVDVTLWTVDGVTQSSAALSFVQAGTGAVTRTVQDKARETVSVLDFDAKCDNSTNDKQAFINAVGTGNRRVKVPACANPYIIGDGSSDEGVLVLYSDVWIDCDNGAVLKKNGGGGTITLARAANTTINRVRITGCRIISADTTTVNSGIVIAPDATNIANYVTIRDVVIDGMGQYGLVGASTTGGFDDLTLENIKILNNGATTGDHGRNALILNPVVRAKNLYMSNVYAEQINETAGTAETDCSKIQHFDDARIVNFTCKGGGAVASTGNTLVFNDNTNLTATNIGVICTGGGGLQVDTSATGINTFVNATVSGTCSSSNWLILATSGSKNLKFIGLQATGQAIALGTHDGLEIIDATIDGGLRLEGGTTNNGLFRNNVFKSLSYVVGNSNTFQANTVISPSGTGLRVDGNSNNLLTNTVLTPGSYGIQVAGDSNVVNLNTIIGSSSGAINVASGTGNKIGMNFGDVSITDAGTSTAFLTRMLGGKTQVQQYAGAGSPESVISATVGSIYHRTDGGASTSLYVKESGTGNTGWVAK